MNFGNILGALMETGLSGSTQKRAQNVFGSAGGIGDMLGSLGDVGGAISGMLGGSKSSGGMLGGVLGDAGRMLGGNKNLALDGLGALAGSLMGGGSKSASSSLGSGAMALLGSLAFSALKSGMQSETVEEVPLGLRQPQNRQEEDQLEKDTELVLKAMINAAKADGRIDNTEIQRIAGKFEEVDADAETREFIMNELKRPSDLRGIITAVGNRPHTAAEVYAASLLAIEVDTIAEKQYMEQLAQGMGLSRQTVAFLENAMGL